MITKICCMICILFIETEKCKPRCWNKTLSEDISFKDGLYRKEIDNEQACKDVCSSNETCMGVYWGFSLSKNILCCYLQVSSQGVSDSLDNANHWQFSNCTGGPTRMTKPLILNMKLSA